MTLTKTKIRSPRVLRLFAPAMRVLRAQPQRSKFVFTDEAGDHLAYASDRWRKLVTRAAKTVGEQQRRGRVVEVPDPASRCHDLRHTFAIHWLHVYRC